MELTHRGYRVTAQKENKWMRNMSIVLQTCRVEENAEGGGRLAED